MNKLFIWRTASVTRETKDTVTIHFDTGSQPFDYKPGQFVNLTILIDSKPVTRSYSLCTAPGIDPRPAITVKKIEGGLMSSYLVDNAAQVAHWQVEGPYGAFTAPSETKHLVLLAAGSGITPVFSIAKQVLHSQPETNITFLYSNRTTDDIIFREQLNRWKEEFGARFNMVHALSQQADETCLCADETIAGRLNRLVIKKLLKKYVAGELDHSQFFICGPSGLIQLHQEALAALEVPENNIFSERYLPEETAPPVELPTQMFEVMLHYYEQSNLLEVQPGFNILNAALTDRIAVPNSCNNGTCGKCAARLTAGNVVMKQNYVLGKEELEAGMVLLCQSYPLNDEVTVEIG
ncbi:ferredoxin--NADP reductase [Pseudoflavitalea sp. G-6-1-2]|uniref:ferredoxin--NADP reductase n=1 Tax=Pseudoflavitalea sp. G-6-1-2 TaxID=2728841 RepID=UPI00146A6953|nr:ferredoxin--NADP reductase [Pseudoflavitalea sp. G-6-1-2]NML22600.1 ferredoxin--NADP reductase [Pseudoflavitalea sp. G-6-1-2]